MIFRKKPDRTNPLAFPPEMVAEAMKHPGAWVYHIIGDYGPADAVPPYAIYGGWKVDDGGKLTGHFEPNPNYLPPDQRPAP